MEEMPQIVLTQQMEVSLCNIVKQTIMVFLYTTVPITFKISIIISFSPLVAGCSMQVVALK